MEGDTALIQTGGIGTRGSCAPFPSIPDGIPPVRALEDPHSALTWTSYAAPPGRGLESSRGRHQ